MSKKKNNNRNISERRSKSLDIRKDKDNRRTLKQRRQDEVTDNTVYFATVIILLVTIASWVSYSTFLYIQEAIK